MRGAAFVDTSFLAGATWPEDSRHAAAISVARAVGRRPLVTTNLVRGETWTVLRRRASHRVAVDFLDALAASAVLRVHPVDAAIEAEAFAWLRDRDEREYSFVDATSFAFMRHHGITEALAFDRDFTAAGFVELRP